MSSPRTRRAFLSIPWIGILALGALAPPGSSQGFGSSDLEPETYKSANGAYELHVDPGKRHGAGPARYELRSNGKVVWSGERPFTYWQCEVCGDGRIIGFAYSQGSGWFVDGEFVVATLAPDGSVVNEERTQQVGSRFLHTSPDPKARGMVLLEDQRRAVIRIAEPDINKGGEDWWVFDLDTGRRVATFSARADLAGSERCPYVVAARAIAGTPLVLAQWFRFDSTGGRSEWHFGARYALLTLDGKAVWHRDLPDDYSIPSDEDAADRLHDFVRTKGTIVDSREARRFTLQLVRERADATFEVARDSAAPQGWKVAEVGRRPWSAAESLPAPDPSDARDGKSASAPSPLTKYRELRLESRGTIVLGGAPAGESRPASPDPPVITWAMDRDGHLALLRKLGSDGNFAVAFVDAYGQPAGERVTIEPPKDAGSPRLVWLAKDTWLATWSRYGADAKSSAWRVDAARGSAEPLPAFDCYGINALAADGSGGFVVLEEHHFKYTSTTAIVRFSAEGARLWASLGASGHSQEFLVSHAMTVTTTGEVVVKGGFGKPETLQVFSLDGKHQRSLPMPPEVDSSGASVWDTMWPDRDGGVAILTGGVGHGRVVRFGVDGRTQQVVDLKYKDGSDLSAGSGLAVDPEGRLWTKDAHALLRIGGNGVVERAVGGSEPDAQQLEGIRSIRLDANDRIYVDSERTGAIHVFDPTGRRLRVSALPPKVSRKLSVMSPFSVRSTGEIVVPIDGEDPIAPQRFVRFDENGKLLGIEEFKGIRMSQNWLWQPSGDLRWIVCYKEIVLFDSAWERIRTIERTPNGSWLRNPMGGAVAPDGSLVVRQTPNFFDRGGEKGLGLHIYDGAGGAVRSLPLPEGAAPWGELAFDGKRIATLAGGTGKNETGCILLIDAETGTVLGKVGSTRSDRVMTPLFPARARELWVFDGDRRIERYALPK